VNYTDINRGLDVVGNSATEGVLISSGEVTHLGRLWNTTESVARALNDARQIVGESRGRAFLWEDGNIMELGALIPQNLGWALGSAEDINNAGQIVGHGYLNGQPHGYLLTPLSPAPLPGDTNMDGSVTATDMALLLGEFGRPFSFSSRADFDADGFVTLRDLGILQDHHGRTSTFANAAVPEPATDSLVLLGVFAALAGHFKHRRAPAWGRWRRSTAASFDVAPVMTSLGQGRRGLGFNT
jgi:hypothetical protein